MLCYQKGMGAWWTSPWWSPLGTWPTKKNKKKKAVGPDFYIMVTWTWSLSPLVPCLCLWCRFNAKLRQVVFNKNYTLANIKLQSPSEYRTSPDFELSISVGYLNCPKFEWFGRYLAFKTFKNWTLWSQAEIHQALLSQFSLIAEFFIGKVPVKE